MAKAGYWQPSPPLTTVWMASRYFLAYPDLPVKVVDNYIDRFRFSDPELVLVQEEINRILASVRDPENSDDLDVIINYS